ncbi:MAG: tetratricopeptide repeat protein [Acidobacteria bacterium]|nr:tetratricopeptide repeat protein [Acidobacteriota bacterium]
MLAVILFTALAATALDRAIADLDAGRLDQAETALRDIVQRAPGSAPAHYHLGITLFRKGQLQAAVAPLSRALQLAPRDAQAWKALGVVYASQSLFELAAEPFGNACRLDPRLPDACYYLARSLYALNRFEPALDAYRKALPVEAAPARVYAGIAQASEALGRTADAERYFRLAEEHNAKAPAARKLRANDDPRIAHGLFLFRQGRTHDALAPLESVAADYPNSAKARLQLGRVLYQLNRIEAALPHLQKAVELDSSSAAAHLLLARVYFRLGRPGDARRHTAIAERLGPE